MIGRRLFVLRFFLFVFVDIMIEHCFVFLGGFFASACFYEFL